MYGICICWNVDVYISCVLCFQSGGGRAKVKEKEKGVVETNSLNVHRAGEVAVVSNPIYFFFNAGVKIIQ